MTRWLERAARAAEQFNGQCTRGFELIELQLDEIRSFLANKNRSVWVFAGIEVSSRLWPSTIVGSRCYRNTRALVRDIAGRCRPVDVPLITTDGFKYYAPAIHGILGPLCVLGQVIKRIQKNRVVKIAAKLILFMRPHGALRFGDEVRTPAMQAGLASRRYSFRDIFGASMPRARRSGRVVAWRLRRARLTSVSMAA